MKALSEITAMVEKAARGAGFPMAHAQNLGRAAAYIAGAGGYVSLICDALEEMPEVADVSWGTGEIRVHAGSAVMIAPVICDAFQMGAQQATLAQDSHVPLIQNLLAQRGIAVAVQGVTLTRFDVPLAVARGPVAIDDARWDHWAGLAARLYVADTAASRLGGAGAGLLDND